MGEHTLTCTLSPNGESAEVSFFLVVFFSSFPIIHYFCGIEPPFHEEQLIVTMSVFPSLFAVIVDESENCATAGNYIK